MSEDRILIGKKIKEIRAKRKITQEAFSEMIDLEPSSLSNIETGKSFPSMVTLLNIMAKFDIKPQEIFDYEYLDSSENLDEKIVEIIKKQPYDRKQILYRIVKSFDV